jgi:hypothetical protein
MEILNYRQRTFTASKNSDLPSLFKASRPPVPKFARNFKSNSGVSHWNARGSVNANVIYNLAYIRME